MKTVCRRVADLPSEVRSLATTVTRSGNKAVTGAITRIAGELQRIPDLEKTIKELQLENGAVSFLNIPTAEGLINFARSMLNPNRTNGAVFGQNPTAHL